MSLFACDKCGVVENTALSHYWIKNQCGCCEGQALCSECSGKGWHGKFPREILTDEKIAETTDWSGWVDCERLKDALDEYYKKMKAERTERKATRLTSASSIYPMDIQRMPNHSRSQRRAKQRAKRAYIGSNV